MAGGLCFDAIVLCLILYLFGKDDADYDFHKVLMVVAGTALGNTVLSVALSSALPPAYVAWARPLVEVAFSAFMVMSFCWISIWKSILVVLIFSLLHVGFGLGMTLVIRRTLGPSATHKTMLEEQNDDMKPMTIMRRRALLAPALRQATSCSGIRRRR